LRFMAGTPFVECSFLIDGRYGARPLHFLKAPGPKARRLA
jgi:hypothetical protein